MTHPSAGRRRGGRAVLILGALAAASLPASAQAVVRIDTALRSAVLQRDMRLSVSLPRHFGYTTARRFPVVVMLDRQNTEIFGYVESSIRHLEVHGQMPASIVVQVETDFPERFSYSDHPDLRAGGLMPQFSRFLHAELLPWLERSYRTNGVRILVGHSAMGHVANYVLAASPTEWTGIVSVSGFFRVRGMNLIDSLRVSLPAVPLSHPLHYFLVHGDPRQDTDQHLLFDSLHSSNVIPPHVRVRTLGFPQANHTAVPGISIATVLSELFAPWNAKRIAAAQQNFDTKGGVPAETFATLYGSLAEVYGDSLGYELPNIVGAVSTYESNHRWADAIALLEYGAREYDRFHTFHARLARAWCRIGDTARMLAAHERALTIAGELALPPSDVEALRTRFAQDRQAGCVAL